MPTPASGAISMNDMRTHINRATGSSISMSEMRTRYGGSGAISFSDLYNTEGFTINPARYSISGKFAQDIDGWSDEAPYSFGSISPDEGNGRIQFAANSWLVDISESETFNPGTTTTSIEPNSTGWVYNGDQVTAGYKATNVTRMVIANTSYSIVSAFSNSTASSFNVSYSMPTSGTLHCLIKF